MTITTNTPMKLPLSRHLKTPQRNDLMILLKTDSKFFHAIWDKKKTCEIRFAGDRQFSVGGSVNLLEIDSDGSYTGREALILVTHLLTHEDFPQGLQPGYTCLSFTLVQRIGGRVFN
jgi:hypothetical protein